MAVHISRPVDRFRKHRRLTSRRHELIGLLMVSAIVGWLVWDTFKTKTADFQRTTEQLETGQLINLSKLSSANPLIPYLEFLPSNAEREFAADKVYNHVLSLKEQGAMLTHVGALASIRVSEPEVSSQPELAALRQRIENARARVPEQSLVARPENFLLQTEPPMVSVALFDSTQLQQLKVRAVVREGPEYSRELLFLVLSYFVVFYIVHTIWRGFRFEGDGIVLPVIHALTGLGLTAMISLRDPLRDTVLFAGFIFGVWLGGFAILVLSFNFWRLRLLEKSVIPLAGSAILSLLLLFLGSGPAGTEAKVNLFGFQPVEVIRILLVLYFAAYFAGRWEFLRTLRERSLQGHPLLRYLVLPPFRHLVPVLCAAAGALAFFFFQRDLGPALVMSVLFFLLYGVARSKAGLAVFGLLLVLAGFFVGYLIGWPSTVRNRADIFLSPWDNFANGGDQIAQSLWAFASGGFLGNGPGQGSPRFIQAGHTDLVLSVLGEEFGFIGIVAIAVLYVVLIGRASRIALRSDTTYGLFVGIGLAAVTAIQLLFIAGGVLGVIPLTGIVTPFLSFGSSAMVCNFAAFGILLSLSARSDRTEHHPHFARPVMFAGAALSIVGAVILLKAGTVQVWHKKQTMVAGALVRQGDGQRRYTYNPRFAEVIALISRGKITDRNGLPLAVSNCAELGPHVAALKKLNVNAEMQCAAAPGRYYPFGGMTFHLLGDLRSELNWSASNTSFVERDWNAMLRGFDDHKTLQQVDNGNGTENFTFRYDYSELAPLIPHRNDPDHPSVKAFLQRNRDVRLSIDARLQAALAGIVGDEIPGGKGAAVILGVDSGEVLASVSYPWPSSGDVRPVNDMNATPDQRLDRARYGIYPPGSTFKVITALSALRQNIQAQETRFVCRRLPDGRVGNVIPGWNRPIRDDVADHQEHGSLNMIEGLVHSCNAYFGQLAVKTGSAALLETADLFNIDVAKPNTAAELRQVLPYAGYGQGEVVVRPLQMARVAATIANKGILNDERWALDDSVPLNSRTVISADVAQLLSSSMRRVVTDGTGRRAAVTGVAVAGKTGTAEVDDREAHSWFMGFAPSAGVADRRIAFAVILENRGYGGAGAATVSNRLVLAAESLDLID